MDHISPSFSAGSEDMWEAQRKTITDLYIGKNLTLSEVMRIMIQQHSFRASEKQYKLKFKKWDLRKNFSRDQAQQIVDGAPLVKPLVRPDVDEAETRRKAERSVKRRRIREPPAATQDLPVPVDQNVWPHTPPQTINTIVPYTPASHGNTSRHLRSLSMEVNERFLFSLRDYTHQAYVFGHWNPESLAKHYIGRQASRSLSSDLTAGTSLSKNGKHQFAQVHWDRALASLQDPNLFKTWYHETPIRLLFEVGRVAHQNHHDLAAKLISEVRNQAQAHLDTKDPRHALFTVFGELQTSQLRDLYELAASVLRRGLESRVDKHDRLLYEIRLNRALDLLWYDGKTDLTKWVPSVEEIDQALGSDDPLSIYFLLLEAYRLTASESYPEADKICSQVRRRLGSLKQTPEKIDLWKVGLAYRRLGRQQDEKGRYEDARRTFNTALMYLESVDKDKSSVLLEIYQCQERLAGLADDDEDVQLWRRKLQQLEEDSMKQQQQVDMSRNNSIFSPEASTDATIWSNTVFYGVYPQPTGFVIDPSNTAFPFHAEANFPPPELTDEPQELYFHDAMLTFENTWSNPDPTTGISPQLMTSSKHATL